MAARHYPIHQWFDSSGNPLTGGTVQGYQAGTTTPKKIYTTKADANADTNGSLSVTLPADGSIVIWFTDAQNLKLVIKDSLGVTIPNGTIDDLAGEGDAATTITLTGALNTIKAADIPSASTVDLNAMAGNYAIVTGTTTITAFGTVQAGAERLLEFSGILTLTYNAVSLILPGSVSITTAAGDFIRLVSLGSGNWKCVSYHRKTGEGVFDIQGANIVAASTTDLSLATGNFVVLTGTTTITAFGTVQAGLKKTVKTTSALTLTHNGTSLICPNGVSLPLAAGDVIEVLSLGSGNWQVLGQSTIFPSSEQQNRYAGALAGAATTQITSLLGDFITISGTATITSLGTGIQGQRVTCYMTSGTILTHNITTLNLPDSVNILAVSGDVATFLCISSGAPANWSCVSYRRLTGSTVLQRVSTQTGAVATGTTAIPGDDTIPQITEGDQYMTLAITPKLSTSILVIDVYVQLANTNATMTNIAALFQDATANALAVGAHLQSSASNQTSVSFRHTMTSGTVAATTFRVRCGATTGATTTFNGTGGGRLFAGTYASSITITEYTT